MGISSFVTPSQLSTHPILSRSVTKTPTLTGPRSVSSVTSPIPSPGQCGKCTVVPFRCSGRGPTSDVRQPVEREGRRSIPKEVRRLGRRRVGVVRPTSAEEAFVLPSGPQAESRPVLVGVPGVLLAFRETGDGVEGVGSLTLDPRCTHVSAVTGNKSPKDGSEGSFWDGPGTRLTPTQTVSVRRSFRKRATRTCGGRKGT